MIVHRDYRDSSASIIKIFDNKIEFYNPGNLYGGITIEDLLSGNYSSKTRNKLIAKVFKETGLIERYGSGIMRVRRICKEHGINEPKFEEIYNGFKVTLFKQKLNDIETVTESREESILRLIKNDNSITTTKLSQLLNVSRRTIARDVENLKDAGIIRRIGSDKSGFWEIIN